MEAINILKTVTVLVARNADEAIVAPEVGFGGICVLQESGLRR